MPDLKRTCALFTGHGMHTWQPTSQYPSPLEGQIDSPDSKRTRVRYKERSVHYLQNLQVPQTHRAKRPLDHRNIIHRFNAEIRCYLHRESLPSIDNGVRVKNVAWLEKQNLSSFRYCRGRTTNPIAGPERQCRIETDARAFKERSLRYRGEPTFKTLHNCRQKNSADSKRTRVRFKNAVCGAWTTNI